MRQITYFIVLLLNVGCDSAEIERDVNIGTLPQPILYGEPSHSAPFLGALLDGAGTMICSAVLLEQRIAITAAHCLESDNTSSEKHLFFGDDISADGMRIPVAVESPYPFYDEHTGYGDLALLLLSGDVEEVPAVPSYLPLTRLIIDRSVRVIGFGRDQGGAQGRKRERQEPILDLERDSFTLGPTICFGDSGGAALLEIDGESLLVGVTASTGTGCQGVSRFTRIDAFKQWIDDETERLIHYTYPESPATSNCAAVCPSHFSLPLMAVLLWAILGPS
jgi:V8-like Glu-specific endopeptidase